MKDYYEILGVSKNSSDEEIKKAFYKLAHKHHPDKAGGDEKKFKEANEAYQVLSDKKKRQQYDQFSAQGGPASGWDFSQQDFGGFGGFSSHGGPSSGWEFNFGEGGFGDIFSDVFGFGHERSETSHKGKDISIEIPLMLEDAAFGVEKDLEINSNILCPKCSGNGAESGTKINTCKKCLGKGFVQEKMQSILGIISTQRKCLECGGRGGVPEKLCSECAGKGIIKKKHPIKIKIPAGIPDGGTLEFSDKGEAAPYGARSGNLFVRARIMPHKIFVREGEDLLMKKNIKLSEAVLGAEVPVETLWGKIQLKIPAGVSSGAEIKVKGKGLPKLHKLGKGDLFVKVEIETPKNISGKAKNIFEELKEAGY
ncbi:MAG: Chaperone protein DnaJ [Parcubacteria group bacterium GW2011_GWA2_39_18]|nr:MAG: Chaperone protein DnaJ [Parcubacteria group bacterium GW2011_GWA2_39_18]